MSLREQLQGWRSLPRPGAPSRPSCQRLKEENRILRTGIGGWDRGGGRWGVSALHFFYPLLYPTVSVTLLLWPFLSYTDPMADWTQYAWLCWPLRHWHSPIIISKCCPDIWVTHTAQVTPQVSASFLTMKKYNLAQQEASRPLWHPFSFK